MNKLEEFAPIFSPGTHAVIGASNSLSKFGGRFIKAQITFGYKGKFFPINREESEIFGMKAYPNVLDIPEPVDFATILVPAPAVPKVLEDCLKKGIKGAQIITAGFSERDEAGVQMEKTIAATAAKGIRVIGPNCFGVYCPRGGLTIPPGETLSKESGAVGCISQSGGFGIRIPRRADGLGIRFSKLVSYGNASDINECDLLEYFYEDPETKIIIGYIEGVKNGPRFFELIKKVTRVKPVILWKGGLTEGGAHAVKSHTASLSGAAQVWEALFKQSGAVSVNGLDELMDATLAFLHLPPIKGRKFCVVGGGGGIGVAAADSFEKAKIPLPVFPRELQQKLLGIVPAQGSSARNPVDVGSPFPTPSMLKAVMETVFTDTDIDALLVSEIELSNVSSGNKEESMHGNMIQQNQKVPVEARDKFGKPVIMVLPEESNGVAYIESEGARRRAADFYLKQGMPVFLTLERAAIALSKFVDYWARRDSIS
ncbi:MAG: CoA-binding protein [Dehalococcoidales bacterium]|nr:CoA-binding protein [Dehalococcoidales bacterium]